MENFMRILTATILILYMTGFFIKNIITSKRTEQNIRAKSWKVSVLTLTISVLYALSFYCMYFQYDFLLIIPRLDILCLKHAGIVLCCIALIFGIATLVTMKNSWRMGVIEEHKTELILNGLFKISRNPYFLSYDLLFLGIFLMYPTLVFLIIYIPVLLLIHSLILDEEKYLTAQHGSVYQDYKKRVRRYI
jgi:protein-S-isoprenylcysteine O-methyltransferase Ste14